MIKYELIIYHFWWYIVHYFHLEKILLLFQVRVINIVMEKTWTLKPNDIILLLLTILQMMHLLSIAPLVKTQLEYSIVQDWPRKTIKKPTRYVGNDEVHLVVCALLVAWEVEGDPPCYSKAISRDNSS